MTASLACRRATRLLIAADRQEAVAETVAALGRLDPGRIAKDRSDLSYQRFFVSKQGLTGVAAGGRSPMPAGFPIHILHLRRYDVDIVPSPDAVLEIGDRVGVLVPPEPRRGGARLLRRHREVGGRIQLRLGGLRHGAGRSARPGSDPHSRASAR